MDQWGLTLSQLPLSTIFIRRRKQRDMAAGISVVAINMGSWRTCRSPFGYSSGSRCFFRAGGNVLLISPLSTLPSTLRLIQPWNTRRFHTVTICFISKDSNSDSSDDPSIPPELPQSTAAEVKDEAMRVLANRSADRKARKLAARRTYLVAAVMSSLGITSMAVAAVYYRFAWQMEGNEVPLTEMFGTFFLSVGAAVGMEFWARWAHRALLHSSLWHVHESHHRPRDVPFELNDVFAIVNALPAISLLSYGFFHRGLVPGLCFGAGLGITLFGIAYMFVHDGLAHRRFPVGSVADFPYFRRVAAAHQIHHSERCEGVPYGLFLGPKEKPSEELADPLGLIHLVYWFTGIGGSGRD